MSGTNTIVSDSFFAGFVDPPSTQAEIIGAVNAAQVASQNSANSAAAAAQAAQGAQSAALAAEGAASGVIGFIAGADPLGLIDSAPAINTAIANLPASGGYLSLPPGNYALNTPINLTNKSLTLVGSGRGVTVLTQSHSGTTITANFANQGCRLTISDMTVLCSNTASTTRFLSATYTAPVPSYAMGSVQVSNVEIGIDALPFANGICLVGCWGAKIENVLHRAATAGQANTSFVELNTTLDTRLYKCTSTYPNAFVLQSGYCEGIEITGCSILGCNYGLVQGPNIVMRGEFTCLGIWLTDNEFAANLGSLKVANVNGIQAKGNHHAPGAFTIGFPTPTWTGYDYTDTQNTTHTGDFFQGPGGAYPNWGINLKSVTAGACFMNTWTNPILTNVVHPAVFGAGTLRNAVLGARHFGGGVLDSSYSDLGTLNTMTWDSDGGQAAAHGRVFSSSTGQSLVVIPDEPGNPNIVVLKADPTSPTVRPDGVGANIAMTISGKGNAPVLLANDNCPLAQFTQTGLGNPGAYLLFENAPAGTPPVITVGGATNLGLTIVSQGTGVLNLGNATGGTTGGVVLGSNSTDRIGFYGRTPVPQFAAPVTLGDVITIIRSLGLSA